LFGSFGLLKNAKLSFALGARWGKRRHEVSKKRGVDIEGQTERASVRSSGL